MSYLDSELPPAFALEEHLEDFLVKKGTKKFNRPTATNTVGCVF